MKRTYRIHKTKEEVINTLNGLIEKPGGNSFKAHIKHSFDLNNRNLVMGTQEGDRFDFWVIFRFPYYERFRINWLYPTINIKLEGSDPTLLIFSHQWNPFGRLLVYLIFASIIYGLVSGIVIQDNMETQFVINRIIISTLLFFFFSSPLLLVYHTKAKTIRKGILEILEEI